MVAELNARLLDSIYNYNKLGESPFHEQPNYLVVLCKAQISCHSVANILTG
jgi:hypothetical protein